MQPKSPYMPQLEQKVTEEVSKTFEIELPSGNGWVIVNYSIKTNAKGRSDAWVGISLFGDTLRVYRNGERILGNPPIENQEVLKALRSNLPGYVTRYIQDLNETEETK